MAAFVTAFFKYTCFQINHSCPMYPNVTRHTLCLTHVQAMNTNCI